MLVRDVEKALQPEGIGRERGNDNSLAAAGELTVEAVGDAALRGRKARTLDICRIAQEGKHALIAELTEARQIDHAVLRHGVDFEVAGEDQRADRRFDRKRNSVCN